MIRPEVGAFCPFSRRDLREVRFNFVFLVPPLVLPLPAALVEAEGFFLACVDFCPHPALAHNPAPHSSNAVIRTVFSRKLKPSPFSLTAFPLVPRPAGRWSTHDHHPHGAIL